MRDRDLPLAPLGHTQVIFFYFYFGGRSFFFLFPELIVIICEWVNILEPSSFSIGIFFPPKDGTCYKYSYKVVSLLL